VSGRTFLALALVALFTLLYLFAEMFDFIWRTQR
jgi:hypothetical protein